MKATTILLCLVVLFAVAQANELVSIQVNDIFTDLWQMVVKSYSDVYKFVNSKMYQYSNMLGIEIVCPLIASIQFS